ncbi:patatin-like phospholipase family protein [Cellulomonas endophytica]|uniref:patatin-like phospholipase family protein n=1 Tax=Cellulomonas endophytica TaxID=2494735 RepID=UPI001F0CCAFB|nr:patatin-like phospholipase family protein [Cellulomonas endophytica]
MHSSAPSSTSTSTPTSAPSSRSDAGPGRGRPRSGYRGPESHPTDDPVEQDGVDATHRRPSGGRRALVLGGGGSTGNAWLLGVVAGLSDAGLDVTDADLTVGTSAGATAAAQLGGATPATLLATALAPVPGRPPTPDGPDRSHGPDRPDGTDGSGGPHRGHRPEDGPAPGRGPGPASDAGRVRAAEDHLRRMRDLIASATGVPDLRRRVAAAALEADAASDGLFSQRWRAAVAARLPDPRWPVRTVLLTALDARTAEPVLLDRRSGVDLVDAVAASCASGLPHHVAGVPYLDGGYRRGENADLAAGYERVVVLAPFGGRSLTPPAWRQDLAAQVEELRAGGSRVATVVPDASSEHLFGASAMDLSLRPEAARAGYAVGTRLVGPLAELWR